MKSKFLLTILACFILSFSVASGQSLPSITLESVDGLTTLGNLPTGEVITFNLRLTNDDLNNTGLTNGFSVASPDGAVWDTTISGTVDNIAQYFTLFNFINFSIDGAGIDTVGFGAISFGGDGLPALYDEVALSITIGPIPESDAGKHIVLDSTNYPQGTWKWATPGVNQYPSWDGPHSFLIGDAPPNTPPVLDPIGAQSVNENELLTINVSAIDAESDPITLITSTLPDGALFTDNGDGTGIFTWTPDFDQAGSYDILFTAFEPSTMSDTETVTITVNNTNRPPTFVSANDDVVVDENQPIQFTVGAIDLDGDNVTLSVGTLPSGATFELNGMNIDEFNWTPTFEQAGVYEIIFTASDGDLSAIDTVMITVNDVNRAPELTPIGAQSTDEGVLLNFAVTATDPDGTTPELSALNLPDGATFLGGTFDWTPLFDQAGSYDVTFQATDGEFTDEEIVTITVNNVNQAPVLAEIGPQIVTAGEVLTFFVTASDIDGTFPTLGATPLPGTATFVDSGNGNGYFAWSTLVSDTGSYDVTFSASDGEFTDEEIVTITVGDAPKMIVVDTNEFIFTFIEGSGASDSGIVNITELNGSPITVEATESAIWMDLSGFTPSVVPVVLTINVHPDSLPIGTYHDTVTISSNDAVNIEAVMVTMNIVERPNTVAYIVSPEDSVFFTDECTPIDIHFVTADDEQDPVSISMSGLVENMTYLDNGDGTADFNFTPNFAQEGVYPLDVVLFDGRDTAFYPISIVVDSCTPGTEGDTVTVATVPAVPGARLTVPIDFANLCNLEGFDISVGWTSENITLDSVSLLDSRLTLPYNIEINNDEWFVRITEIFPETEVQAPGSGNLVNLHFSLDVGISAGTYPLDFYMEPMFNRDCGGGAEQARPFFIPGAILVDTSGNYVCGYVVDPGGNPVPGATVELWDNFPTGAVQDAQDASGNGVFSFADFNTIPFDLYAYHEGFYPGRVENINFAQSGIMIVLTPIPEAVTPTNVWVDFFCGVNTFKNSPLPVGSVIEAYDPDGVKCGEFNVTTAGEYGFLHCYGDDEFTTEDEGAVAGDVIRFFVNGIEAITGVPAIWTEDRAIIEVCLDVPDVTPHSCMLFTGWNLVSWNVDTDIDDIANVLSSIDNCVEVVLGFEQGALTYDASLPQFSDLWMVDHLSAYWIKVSCDVELTVLGTPVPSTTPIPVTAGWNLVSYLPEYSLPTDVALTTIHDDLVVALGYDNSEGLTYLPGQTEFNNLISMSSCFGYWVKVNNDGTLIYPEAVPTDSAPAITKGQYAQVSSSAGRINGTTSWMNIYAYDLKLNDVQVKAGSEIKAFDQDDRLVGSYVMKETGKFGFMPIYGDDYQTENIDGMKSGDEFYLTVDGIVTSEKFTWTTSGDKMELKGLTAKTTNGELPNSFNLAQNYPNPFNPSTKISFELPVSGEAKIEIFNMLGQLIATPYNEVSAAGLHEITWDGRNEDGKSVASGIYFYRLTADNFTNTKKMTLLK